MKKIVLLILSLSVSISSAEITQDEIQGTPVAPAVNATVVNLTDLPPDTEPVYSFRSPIGLLNVSRTTATLPTRRRGWKLNVSKEIWEWIIYFTIKMSFVRTTTTLEDDAGNSIPYLGLTTAPNQPDTDRTNAFSLNFS